MSAAPNSNSDLHSDVHDGHLPPLPLRNPLRGALYFGKAQYRMGPREENKLLGTASKLGVRDGVVPNAGAEQNIIQTEGGLELRLGALETPLPPLSSLLLPPPPSAVLPLSPISGQREYKLPQLRRTSSLIYPFRKERNVYRNYLTSRPKDCTALSAPCEPAVNSSTLTSPLSNEEKAYGNHVTSKARNCGESSVLRMSAVLPLAPEPQTHKAIGKCLTSRYPSSSTSLSEADEACWEELEEPEVHRRGDWNKVHDSENKEQTGRECESAHEQIQYRPGQTRPLYPKRDLPQDQYGTLQMPGDCFSRPITSLDTSYERENVPTNPFTPEDENTAEQLVEKAIEEQIRDWNGERHIPSWSMPSKSHRLLGAPELKKEDDCMLKIPLEDDRFKDLEGLYDSGPYIKLQQQQLRYTKRAHEHSRIKQEGKQQTRIIQERWKKDYDLGSTVIPGDSISQISFQYRQPSTKLTRHQDLRYEADDTQNQFDVYPRPLVPALGSISTTTKPALGEALREKATTTRKLVSKVSRFLLSAPSNPALKTWSNQSMMYKNDAADEKGKGKGRESMLPSGEYMDHYRADSTLSHRHISFSVSTVSDSMHSDRMGDLRLFPPQSSTNITLLPSATPIPPTKTPTRRSLALRNFLTQASAARKSASARAPTPRIDKSSISSPMAYIPPSSGPDVAFLYCSTTTTTTAAAEEEDVEGRRTATAAVAVAAASAEPAPTPAASANAPTSTTPQGYGSASSCNNDQTQNRNQNHDSDYNDNDQDQHDNESTSTQGLGERRWG